MRVVYVEEDERGVHVPRLRQKLELDPRKKPGLLETIGGLGYVLTPGAP
jgi:DNA-binding response OmpR family regulator